MTTSFGWPWRISRFSREYLHRGFTGHGELFASTVLGNFQMTMSDDELIELECMESVARTGALPDGCDASRLMGMNYLRSDSTLVLTDRGRERLLELRAQS